MKFIASADLPHIKDVDFFMKHISKLIEKEMEIGIQIFFQNLLSRIPVLTGFLRGSYAPIALKYGVQDNVSAINTRPMFYKKTVLKTPTSGQSYTKGKIIKSGTLIMFELRTNIDYMAINDFNSVGSGTPWGAIDAATQGFVKYMENIGNKLSILTPVLSTYVVRVEGTGVSKTIREKRV